ncbi:Hypothetical predicted protein [Paramuricea clavata]|uniref:Uncharacterized protein n=1 Tax=Paramuricea clavata TaxID=317549 RepID=A0A6S7JGM8_PARCT|nr:Hypothetical predicted protein [Paramuricea clavata]
MQLGADYEKLVEECEKFKQQLTLNLAKTCETRFVNSKRLVFINMIKDLEPVVSCLQNTQMGAIDDDAKKRQKGSDAAALSSSILNTRKESRLCQENVVASATHELKVFTEKLSKELEENIFDEDDVKVISHTKTITDLKSILYTVKHDGPIKTVATKADQYVKSIRELPVRSVASVPDNVLYAQFHDLVARIKSLVPMNTDTKNINSKDIIKVLINESCGNYKEIEKFVQAVYQ